MTQHMIVWQRPTGYNLRGNHDPLCAAGKIERVAQLKRSSLILLINPLSRERVWAAKAW